MQSLLSDLKTGLVKPLNKYLKRISKNSMNFVILYKFQQFRKSDDGEIFSTISGQVEHITSSRK